MGKSKWYRGTLMTTEPTQDEARGSDAGKDRGSHADTFSNREDAEDIVT